MVPIRRCDRATVRLLSHPQPLNYNRNDSYDDTPLHYYLRIRRLIVRMNL